MRFRNVIRTSLFILFIAGVLFLVYIQHVMLPNIHRQQFARYLKEFHGIFVFDELSKKMNVIGRKVVEFRNKIRTNSSGKLNGKARKTHPNNYSSDKRDHDFVNSTISSESYKSRAEPITFASLHHSTEKPKVLLIYTRLFGRLPWRAIPYDYNFTELDGKTPCSVNKCRITYNKSHLNFSDAVYFHGRDLPSPQALRQLRGTVDKKQIWIWFMHESPEFTFYNPRDYDGVFNWSSTYSPKSEVFVPYIGTRLLSSREIQSRKVRNFADGKDKMVLFIASNCLTSRMNFVRRLKQFVAVDVYGACKTTLNPELPDCPKNSVKCLSIQSRYKFYLAMENSFCEDYITEKYYRNSLQRGLVPIVFGGANYSAIALPGSFVNVRDFSNLERLAEHLHYLDSNDTAYNEYFRWFYKYNVELQHGMCKVCKALWNPKIQAERSLNLSQFWSPTEKCLNKTKVISAYL